MNPVAADDDIRPHEPCRFAPAESCQQQELRQRKVPLLGCLARGSKDLEETVTKLADLPLAFHPGSKWNYGLSTDVSARLVEVISGQRFDRFLEERIFEPLGAGHFLKTLLK